MFQLPKQTPPKFVKPKGDEQRRIVRMRIALVMASPYWGLLATRLKLKADPACGTAGTNGKHLLFNPAYIAGLSDKELMGLIAHEVEHCAAGHIWRRGERNHRVFNIACDYVIDQLLTQSGFDVPNPLINPDWNGWWAEKVYDVLMQEIEKELQKQQQKGKSTTQQGGAKNKEEEQGQGEQNLDEEGDTPGESADRDNRPSLESLLNEICGGATTKGEVMDASPETAMQDQAEWKQAMVSAAKVAKSQGKLPGNLELLIGDQIAPRVDWKSVLRKFVQMNARNDFTWRSPSKRYAASGLYLPSLQSETMPPIIVAIDTSGSIGGDEFRMFAAELASIIEEAKPESAHIVYCDAQVQGKPIEWLQGDPIVMKPCGGGGTCFKPPFAWAEAEGIEPSCLIYLTDCFGDYPEEPPYPVLWASTTKDRDLSDHYRPPFGDMVYLDFEE
jgi:predicted metal-dependent peptidase